MKQQITISVQEYNDLRRSLTKALNFLQSLGVQEQTGIDAPVLTPKQKRELKYERLLASGKQPKKSDIIN